MLSMKSDEIRHRNSLRQVFHNVFDPIWKNKWMRRDEAYIELADRCGFYAHGGCMDAAQCQLAIMEAAQMKEELRKKNLMLNKKLSKALLNERQNAVIDRIYEHDATVVVAPTGGGKTVTTLTAIAELQADRHVGPVVVAAPAKVVPNWAKEAGKWDHLTHLRVVTLTGPANARRKKLAGGFDVAVISLNSFEWFCNEKHTCTGVVIDELSKACGKQTASLKTKSRGDCFKWRVGLTATPVSENFEKLFKMVRIIDKGAALGRNFDDYRNTYFRPDFNGHTWTLLPGADALITAKVKGLIHLMDDTKDEDLPPLYYNTIEFDMSARARAAYEDMRKDLYAEGVEAVNAAVKSSKLRQIASGFIYDEDGDVIVLDYKRLERAVLWAAGVNRGVIFYEYEEQGRDLMASFDSATQDPDEFKSDNAIRFLVMQYQSGSHGLDGLQHVCQDMLFYHPLWSRDATEQAVGRLWRTGQKKPVKVTTLVCRGSLDEVVMQRVDGKGQFMRMFREHLRKG